MYYWETLFSHVETLKDEIYFISPIDSYKDFNIESIIYSHYHGKNTNMEEFYQVKYRSCGNFMCAVPILLL